MAFSYDTAARAMQVAAGCERAKLVSDPAKLPPAMRATLVPFIGWIGPSYSGGTVVIGKDPGGLDDGSKPKGRRLKQRDHVLDAQLEDALLALPKHTDPSAAMRTVSALFLKQMPYNGIRVVLDQIAQALDEPIESMAFFNICPYRTRGPSFIKGLTHIASRLVPALSAHTVLILNKQVGDDLPKLPDPTLSAKWPRVLHRLRSDVGGLHDEGLRVVKQLAADPAWRSERGRT